LNSGHWRSTDGGETWEPAAVGREPGTAQNLFFSPTFPDDQTAYLLLRPDSGTSLSLQRSVDAGRSWESLLGGPTADFEIAWATILPNGELHLTAADGSSTTLAADQMDWGRLPVDISQLDLQALAIAPEGTIFVANSGAGVFKSVDGGRSWTETNFPARADEVLRPAQLAITDDGTLFATAGPVIAHSTDGGETWTYLDGLPTGFEIASLAVSPSFVEDGVVVVGGSYRDNQILRSADGGESWESVFDGSATDIEYASDLSALAFSPDFARDGALYAWLQEGGPLRSTDGGLSWELAAESDYYGQTLAPSPAGDQLYLGALGGNVLVSEDGGEKWLDLSQNIPDDRTWSTALAFSEDGALFLGTDKGVYRSLDGGGTWIWASAGLPMRPADETSQSVRDLRFHDGRLYAALVEGGLYVSDDLGESWHSTMTHQPDSPEEMSPTPTPSSRTLSVPSSQIPTSQASMTPSDCPSRPDHFADLWTERVAQLGCPVVSYTTPMAEQSFEGGWMFWRSDTSEIYALPLSQPYGQFDDTWDESQPVYSCPELAPSQTPPTPQRGFGKVWCSEPMISQLLGTATSGERLFDARLQEFDSGLIFEAEQGVAYILETQSNGWERVQ
jgi:photosystem II stability/assembly factor-like uncharacterized protein